MRTARPPPLQNPSRSAHGRLRIHRGLVQSSSPPFRPRLSFTDQLRKDSANRKSDRKPNTVHRNGVAPYNPRKHGRPSHHPLLAILAEAKVVLHAWLRSGNTASARGVIAFLAETLAKLPPAFRLYALRADSGFFV